MHMDYSAKTKTSSPTWSLEAKMLLRAIDKKEWRQTFRVHFYMYGYVHMLL